ncbi:DoxX family membrane protein [Fulvivirgaceae bacterium BMA10]|uniref:DoxX family membrane protein n=1 Tax=Splendidivirga corallicola TaxID=3051826 RepID=A0ABT8KNC2_9BACT|nr:DoxX family membrane protein [Fulvivirgaceae bacterium BMA10]
MKSKITLVARILLGLMLLLFGLNKFFQFMPPFEMTGAPKDFMDALVASGYIMTVVAIVEVGTGLLLVINKYVPLALLLLAPITVNIILFHVFLDIATIGGGLIIAILQVYLLFAYKEKFSGVLQAS